MGLQCPLCTASAAGPQHSSTDTTLIRPSYPLSQDHGKRYTWPLPLSCRATGRGQDSLTTLPGCKQRQTEGAGAPGLRWSRATSYRDQETCSEAFHSGLAPQMGQIHVTQNKHSIFLVPWLLSLWLPRRTRGTARAGKGMELPEPRLESHSDLYLQCSSNPLTV